MSLFGIEGGGRAISQTTPVAIQRLLSYFSSMPVFLDEYRNTRDVASKTHRWSAIAIRCLSAPRSMPRKAFAISPGWSTAKPSGF